MLQNQWNFNPQKLIGPDGMPLKPNGKAEQPLPKPELPADDSKNPALEKFRADVNLNKKIN